MSFAGPAGSREPHRLVTHEMLHLSPQAHILTNSLAWPANPAVETQPVSLASIE
jgi:hypothetical protein